MLKWRTGGWEPGSSLACSFSYFFISHNNYVQLIVWIIQWRDTLTVGSSVKRMSNNSQSCRCHRTQTGIIQIVKTTLQNYYSLSGSLDKFAYYVLVGDKMSMFVLIYPSDNHVMIDVQGDLPSAAFCLKSCMSAATVKKGSQSFNFSKPCWVYGTIVPWI